MANDKTTDVVSTWEKIEAQEREQAKQRSKSMVAKDPGFSRTPKEIAAGKPPKSWGSSKSKSSNTDPGFSRPVPKNSRNAGGIKGKSAKNVNKLYK